MKTFGLLPRLTIPVWCWCGVGAPEARSIAQTQGNSVGGWRTANLAEVWADENRFADNCLVELAGNSLVA